METKPRAQTILLLWDNRQTTYCKWTPTCFKAKLNALCVSYMCQCLCSNDTKKKGKIQSKLEVACGPSSCPCRSSLAGGLTTVQHVLVLGSSLTVSAICHIAPRLLGNYSSNLKRQRYLICRPTGREWAQQSQRSLCSLSHPCGFEMIWGRQIKAQSGCFLHQPGLLSVEETNSFLKAKQAARTR